MRRVDRPGRQDRLELIPLEDDALPDLEIQEKPQPIAMLPGPRPVLLRQAAQGSGLEEAPAEGPRPQDEILDERPEGAPEPAADGGREPHLRPPQDRARHEVTQGRPENRLGREAAQLVASW